MTVEELKYYGSMKEPAKDSRDYARWQQAQKEIAEAKAKPAPKKPASKKPAPKKEAPKPAKKTDTLEEHTKKVAANITGTGGQVKKTVKKLGATDAQADEIEKRLQEQADAQHKIDTVSLDQSKQAQAEQAAEAQNEAIKARNATLPANTKPNPQVEARNGMIYTKQDSEPPADPVEEAISSDPDTANLIGLQSGQQPDSTNVTAAAEAIRSETGDEATAEAVDSLNQAIQSGDQNATEQAADRLKQQAMEASKTGAWDVISKILTLISPVVSILSGGLLPPAVFTSHMFESPEETDTNEQLRQQKVESAVEAQRRSDIYDINEAGVQRKEQLIAQKTQEYMEQGYSQQEASQKAEQYAAQVMNEQYASSEQAAKDRADLDTWLTQYNVKDAPSLIIKLQEQKQQLLKEKAQLSTADADRFVHLASSLVPLLGQLETTTSSSNRNSALHDSISGGGGVNFLDVFSVNAGGETGSQKSSGSSYSHATMSREGLVKAEQFYNSNQTEFQEAKRELESHIDAAIKDIDAQIAIAKQGQQQYNPSAQTLSDQRYKKRRKYRYIRPTRRYKW